MTTQDRKDMVRENYDAFRAKLGELLPSHRGKFALMRNKQIVELFDTARDAFIAGQKLYDDGLFSVQEVADKAADLGFFSHALP